MFTPAAAIVVVVVAVGKQASKHAGQGRAGQGRQGRAGQSRAERQENGQTLIHFYLEYCKGYVTLFFSL